MTAGAWQRRNAEVVFGYDASALPPKGQRSRSCSPNVVPVMKRAASQRGIQWMQGGNAAAALAPARDAARGRLLALGAGLLAAGALAFTARNVALSRERRLTGRCARAVEQLGSEELDVRIGGIRVLERVARDAPAYHPAVIEMLAAFIRERSHPQWPHPDPGGQAGEPSLRPDVQAAMTAVGRRLAERDTGPVDLARADLTGADLTGADLTGADLSGARLTGADLTGADLTGASLADTDLTGADLTLTDLTRAELTGALWPQGRPVPAGWTRHAGSGQLIPAGADAEKTAANQARG